MIVRVGENGETSPRLETEAGPFAESLRVGQDVELRTDDGHVVTLRVLSIGSRILTEQQGAPNYVVVELE